MLGLTTAAVGVLLLIGSRAPGAAPPLVARPVPLEIAAAVHFGIGGEYNYQPAETARALRSLGIARVRDNLPWVDFLPDGPAGTARMLPKLAAFAAASTARPLLILGHRHPAVENGALPTQPASIAAFGRYVEQAVRATRGRKADYEIWNEWNMEAAAPGQAAGSAAGAKSPEAYAVVARAGVAAVRASAPGARVLVGAVGDDPGWQWISRAVRAGAATEADGVSVHLYNHCEAPAFRTGDRAIAQLEELHTVAQRDGWGDVPIWVTEAGWPTPQQGVCGVTPAQAGTNLAQLMLWAAATPWLRGVTVYQLKDQGLDGNDLEANFGILDYYYRPKPAACLVREAGAVIAAASRVAVHRPREGLTVVELSGRRGHQAVVWSATPSTLRSDGGAVRYRPLCGEAATAAQIPTDARPVVIDLSRVPGGVAGLRPA